MRVKIAYLQKGAERPTTHQLYTESPPMNSECPPFTKTPNGTSYSGTGVARTRRSRAQKMAKINVGKSNAVARVLRFHIFPLKNLYIVADQ